MEYKYKNDMIDNRRVKDDHGRRGNVQCDSMAAIKRVMQKGDNYLDYCGHDGDMEGGWNHGKVRYNKGPRRIGSEQKGHGYRNGNLTPRKA